MVHDLPAAAPQLQPAAAHPVGAAHVGLQPPRTPARAPAEPAAARGRTREAGRRSGPVRTYSLFLIGIGVFFGIIGLVYWFFSYEDGGFLMLIGTTLLGLFPGSYYLWWSYHSKRQAE